MIIEQATDDSRPTVAVVMAAMNEAAALPVLISQVLESLEAADVRPAVYVVDDGSTDRTADVVLQIRESDPRVHLVGLSRNFGHQAALLAGLHTAQGDAVICMDADGQHPAEVLPELIQRWRAGADVVHTVRSDPPGLGWFKRITASIFYRAFRWLSGLPLENGMADFRLLDRGALDATLRVAGNRPFFRGSAVWIGYSVETVPYVAGERVGGESSFSLRAMTQLARDGVVGFSARPLWIISGLGMAASFVAFLIAFYAVAIGLVSSRAVPGWASTIGFLAVLQGLTFALLGVFGVYLGAVFAEVLDRPPYLIRGVDEQLLPGGREHRHRAVGPEANIPDATRRDAGSPEAP